MRYFAFLLHLLAVMVASSQPMTFQALMDSGKAEYNRQLQLPSADFRKANDYFENAVRLQPTNTTAKYFYGYSIDKLNSSDGAHMDRAGLALTIRASEQFEFINRVEPYYGGEMLVLDPYSKIQALWGSLAFAYLNKGKGDLARWAFSEGKRRGGFLEPILTLNQSLLNACTTNAVFITSGDNVTFPLLYLQLVKNIRKDVTVIDANLLHSSWYPKFLKREKRIGLSYTDEAIDTVSYQEWTTTTVTLTDSGNKKVFSWSVKPTYHQIYFLRGDKILLDVLKQTIFKRDIFYSELEPDSSISLCLNDHLIPVGLVSKLVVNNFINDDLKLLFKPLAFTISPDQVIAIKNSPSATSLLNNYRVAYYHRIWYYLSQSQAKAIRLFNEMKAKFPDEVLPYDSYVRKYEEQLFARLH